MQRQHKTTMAEIRTKYNSFLSTPSEAAVLRQIAVERGLTLSDFVRTAICNYVPGALTPHKIKVG